MRSFTYLEYVGLQVVSELKEQEGLLPPISMSLRTVAEN
jgi:hypothetical protein